MTDYDAELRLYNEALHRAWELRPDDHVLDVGCGSGRTTRDAARLAATGSALGVDVSAAAIERARRLARTEGLRNVGFEHADAQTHPFAPERFTVAISRFGTMFFADPVAAFANIGRALRPHGRLVMMVWQAPERNEWEVAIRNAFASPPAVEPAFSLADPAATEGILQAAGFADVTFLDVRQPVYYGADVATALDWVGGFTYTKEALGRLAPGAASRTLGRLEETLVEHMSDDGVRFDSAAWIVTAHRRHDPRSPRTPSRVDL